MDSPGHSSGHLDATEGREVVYCHACSHEWYRDEHGLVCPECESDVTEIVSVDNDPRDIASSPTSPSPESPALRYAADDLDPDEADIEEHLGPHGYHFRRTTGSGSEQRHQDDSTVDPVFQRFYDMISSFGQPQPRQYEGGGLFNRHGNDSYTQPRVQRTTFTSGTFGGGTASVTIFSSPAFSSGASGAGEGNSPNHGSIDPFQAIFSNVIRDMGPPEGAGGAGGPQAGFARGLQEILNLFNPANAMMGDAVYSQEALDRIITQLMEANPQSNAAPPATEEGLSKLERKVVNKDLLGPEGKVECSICIDEMKEGETAAFLPCKHWFHEECVVLWLKEHNTCPVCRTPIEKNERSEANNAQDATPASGNSAASANAPGSAGHQTSDSSTAFGNRFHGGADTPTGRAAADMLSSVQIDSQHQPLNPSQTRTNTAFGNATSLHRQFDGEERRDRDRATSSGTSYDTSRLQRRTSHSPTSPRATNLAEQGARMRQRSPSESSRRGAGDRDNRRQSSQGPLSWLRDRLSGGNSGNANHGS